MNKTGRPAGVITYTNIVYDDKEYTVGSLTSKGKYIKYVFDTEDFHKVEGKSWHHSSNAYISYGTIFEGKRKQNILCVSLTSRMYWLYMMLYIINYNSLINKLYLSPKCFLSQS